MPLVRGKHVGDLSRLHPRAVSGQTLRSDSTKCDLLLVLYFYASSHRPAAPPTAPSLSSPTLPVFFPSLLRSLVNIHEAVICIAGS